ncbi:MAG: hypothetical protein JWQ48_1053 [Conexibacter sp.]|nr:hypothetical protein [Conexibacter sp.]
MTVDLALPEEGERAELRLDPRDASSPLVVPLGVMRKAQLIDFDLREGSSPLMLVRSELNAHVAAAIIGQEAASEGASPREVSAAWPLLERIAGADRDASQDAFERVFATDAGGAFGAGGAAWTIAEQLLTSYILLIELPETGSRRRLIRFATDQIVGVRDEHGSVAQRLGLQRAPLVLDLPGVDQAASYHAEVLVPPGSSVTAAVVQDGDRSVAAATQLTGRRAAIFPRSPSGRRTQLVLDVGQERGYYLLPAAIVSGLIALLLLAGVAVTWAGRDPEPTASAILLSGLGIVTGLVVRGDEQPLTAELHGLARAVLTVVMVAALAAAAVVALGATGYALAALWSLTLVISVGGAATLLVSASRATRSGTAETTGS